MPPEPGRSLTAEDIKLIGELLIPAVKDALRDELHKVRREANEALLASHNALAARMDKIEVRVGALEVIKNKATLLWGIAVFAASMLGSYFLKRLFG